MGRPMAVAAIGEGGWKEQSNLSESDPATRLRQMISDRRPETVEILKSWMEDAEETA